MADLSNVTRLAAYAIVQRQDKYLLCRIAPGFPGAGRWTLLSGGLDFGEDPAAGVLRELEEETGLLGQISGEERVEVDGSSDAFGWFNPDEIAGLDRVGLIDEALA